MPALTNAKYEKACQERAKGTGVAASYEAGGFSGNPATATKFFKRHDIASRVTEIIADKYEDQRKAREIATKEAGIDEAWIVKRLKYLADISLQGRPIKDAQGNVTGMTKPDGPTAIKCLTLAAQMRGLLIQKHEIGAPGDFARMSDEELDSALLEQARGLGLPEPAVMKLIADRSSDTVQ
jgi:hypothetical protein